jgi:1,4-alpha-glucan branching enzyme
MINRNAQGDVEFRYYHPNARHVYLVGDFNDWNSSVTPMTRTSGGEWVAILSLADGMYEYKYLVDGKWYLDDAAAGVEEVPFGTNCILVLNQSAVPALPVG